MSSALLLAALVPQLSTSLDLPAHDGRRHAVPNILLVLVDDVGVDLVNAYGEAPAAVPCTPHIDALAADGTMFRHAWASPVCSPTRAGILTGRYSFRHTVGDVLRIDGSESGLPVSERTIPEVLAHYSSAVVGKWHLAHPWDLANGQGPLHPLNSGFDRHSGPLFNFFQLPIDPTTPCDPPYSYMHWIKTVDGEERCTNNYQTTETVDDAMWFASHLEPPWFLFVSPNAVHLPSMAPPPHLCSDDPTCSCSGLQTLLAERVRSMVEALDTELGRLFAYVRALDPETMIIFVGDNGTEATVTGGQPGGCFDPLRSKGTVFEGGVRVPLIVNGPGVSVGEVTAPVALTDLYATVLELGGRRSRAEDSVSLVPYLAGDPTPRRETVYTERFSPNGDFAQATTHQQAIRNATHKLIRLRFADGSIVERMYDLAADPCETTDLLPAAPGSEVEASYLALIDELTALGVY